MRSPGKAPLAKPKRPSESSAKPSPPGTIRLISHSSSTACRRAERCEAALDMRTAHPSIEKILPHVAELPKIGRSRHTPLPPSDDRLGCAKMAMPVSIQSQTGRSEVLASAELRASLARFIRGRVPEADLDDVVQATLTDAFAATQAPDEPEEVRRWGFGIAKNKVADFHRRGRREAPNDELVQNQEAPAESAPISARELLNWAEKELPDADGSKSTLEWMLREGD